MIMKCYYNIAHIMLQFYISKMSLYCIAICNVATLL